MNKSKINMTEGPLFGKILKFVLPLMVTNLLQVFYNAADMIIVSLSHEPNAVGAIGLTAPMINLFVNIFIGFSVGANVVVARNIGIGDQKNVSRAVHTSICVSVIFGITGGLIGILSARPILIIMGNSGNMLQLAVKYVTIYFIGTPFLSVTNYVVAILRGEGDTKTPLFVMSGTGLLNVLLNLFFVLVCGLSVEGVALATTIANAASAVILLTCLARKKSDCKFSFKKLKIDKTALISIIQIGLPAGIQGALFSLSNLIIQSSIIKVNNMVTPADVTYQPVVKGNAAAGNLEGFAYTATNSVYQAATSFTGQNAGAKKYKRISSVMKNCYFITFCIAGFFTAFMLILKGPLLSLYGVAASENTADMIAFETATTRFLYMFSCYFLLAFMEIGSGVLRGFGKSLTATFVTLFFTCIFRIVWIFSAFAAFPSLGVIYISYPISWGMSALINFICCVVIQKKHIKEQETQTVSE